uniref:Right-handed parallel beta-helix repeat-containing protein n=1 Tax=Schlesneria paludicola TaxID=360056 RepID=A0A7C2NZ45_9PLAN
MSRWLSLWIVIVVGLTDLLQPARAADIHVDSANGFDGNDGLAAVITTATNGPVRTLKRATQLAQAGDRIVLKSNGQPFFETLYLTGGRHCGFASRPFTIEGNGAVISGLRDLPPDGWRPQGPGLWRLSLTRKGHYRFFRDNQPIPEFLPTTRSMALDDLPLDHYFSHQGAVIFRFDEGYVPYTELWTYAAADIGVSLVDVRNLQIRNLTIVGFRVDGLNADGNCRGVVLDNVTLEHNGRAGLSANGTSQVFVESSRLTGNGRHSAVITEYARVNLQNTDDGGVEPTVIE